MSDAADEARALFVKAQERQAAHDTSGTVAFAKLALELDPQCVEAIELLATIYVTRQRRYVEGLALMERAVALRSEDAGLWYGLGWCCEFAAHEVARRRPTGLDVNPHVWYARAAEAFRRCLSLRPGGKLADDAADLLDHVENELR